MTNVLQQRVEREYAALRPTIEGFCGCEMCRDDVLVYALNRLPPRYAAQGKGTAFSDVEDHAGQSRADVARTLLTAFRIVSAAPRKGHPPPG